ncbi:MAG: cupin domain-containing protein [Verrucomicrobia bacterium]|nr:cupin domain-containing protein [Verrucomicrobiota bacterium]
MTEPITVIFKDDGTIPNSRFPILLYRRILNVSDKDPACSTENLFAANDWTRPWRNGVYPYHHYHSTSHEVLGVYSGSATIRLGGEDGTDFTVRAGDVIVIPGGVGHKNLGSSRDFAVVGAYPEGRDCDLLRGKPDDRPAADRNIARLPIPKADPIYGEQGPLRKAWN